VNFGTEIAGNVIMGKLAIGMARPL